ncbi:MAG TPA: hypothetical protein VFY73_16365, partial [Ideonella sp.]|uniref:hypothetical protein n=1 Tax=Ideonella sp. TaxID=1929293 RepID=UPI002E33DAB9
QWYETQFTGEKAEVFTMNLATAGTYTIEVSPSDLDEGTIDLQLKTPGGGPLLKTDGTPRAVAIGNQGIAWYSMNVEAGTAYTAQVTGLGFEPTTGSPGVAMHLYSPSGTWINTSCTFTTSKLSCDLGPSLFTVGGTYSLAYIPTAGYATGFSASMTKK